MIAGSLAGVGEGVLGADGHRDERSGGCLALGVADRESSGARDHVERLVVLLVPVGGGPSVRGGTVRTATARRWAVPLPSSTMRTWMGPGSTTSPPWGPTIDASDTCALRFVRVDYHEATLTHRRSLCKLDYHYESRP